jgi:hypothetical protein
VGEDAHAYVVHFGMLLGALGGRVVRGMREREQEQAIAKPA